MKTEATEKKDGTVTIKDISSRLNVSSTSVHRALSGKVGVSETLRQKIIETANEMGYTANYAAAALKRKTIRIAAVLPQDDGLYFDSIWQGLRACEQEIRGLNIEVVPILAQDEFEQKERLKEIADSGSAYSGVVTYSFTPKAASLLQMQRLVSQKVATVLLDENIVEPEGLYCIPSNAAAVGRVAGELVSLITPETGTVLISGGRKDAQNHTEKRESFVEYLHQHKPGIRVVVAEGFSRSRTQCETIHREMVNAMKENRKELVAAYALTAIDDVQMVRAAQEAELLDRIHLVGTDLNRFTADCLRQGSLKAVIDQGAYMKGYTGLKLLVDKILKNEEPTRRFDCPVEIVLASNLRFYEHIRP